MSVAGFHMHDHTEFRHKDQRRLRPRRGAKTRSSCLLFPQSRDLNHSSREIKAPPGMPKKRKKNGKMMLSYPREIASSTPNSSRGW